MLFFYLELRQSGYNEPELQDEMAEDEKEVSNDITVTLVMQASPEGFYEEGERLEAAMYSQGSLDGMYLKPFTHYIRIGNTYFYVTYH